jgi:hypothetical protein
MGRDLHLSTGQEIGEIFTARESQPSLPLVHYQSFIHSERFPIQGEVSSCLASLLDTNPMIDFVPR